MNTSKNLCVVCGKNSQLRLSCDHDLCTNCAEGLIKVDNYNCCPKCNDFLKDDINKLFVEHMNKPANKINNDCGFNNGDFVWVYSGANGKWWSFTSDQCKNIEDEYQSFLDDNELDEMKLTVSIGSIYVLNFNNMTQHSYNDNTKKRSLKRFEFKSFQDIVDNNVVGIAGKKF